MNCAAIPEELVESEFFGHERGAFTGATARRPGYFEQADGGTLLLDEIADLSPSAQAKLLRAIETGETRPVGARCERHFDVRVLAATNRDLGTEVACGRFRHDLYYRLQGSLLHVPAADIVAVEDLTALASSAPPGPPTQPARTPVSGISSEPCAHGSLRRESQELERRRILEVLEKHGGNKTRAARDLGLARTTLITKLKKLVG